LIGAGVVFRRGTQSWDRWPLIMGDYSLITNLSLITIIMITY